MYNIYIYIYIYTVYNIYIHIYIYIYIYKIHFDLLVRTLEACSSVRTPWSMVARHPRLHVLWLTSACAKNDNSAWRNRGTEPLAIIRHPNKHVRGVRTKDISSIYCVNKWNINSIMKHWNRYNH